MAAFAMVTIAALAGLGVSTVIHLCAYELDRRRRCG